MSERTLTYEPALDGVRAVAVVMVLLFHHGFDWMSGGYVGVSVFFTLSGYLITSLLLVEHRDRQTISLGRFYTRRARRLLPAGLLCLGLIVLARVLGEFENVPRLRRDVLGSLFQVQNWVQLFGPASYTELLNASVGEVSPLEHYWSLAIEEQFYWLWPLGVLGLFAAIRSWRARRIAITALAVVAAVAAPLVAGVWGEDAAYWATPARIGEILIGATLAVWMRGETSAKDRRAPALRGALAGSALVVIVLVGVLWPDDGGPAYEGWLPLFALASATLIAGLSSPSIVRTAMSMRPVVGLGRISYGVYLYHWPVFVLLSESRTGVGGTGLFAIRTAVTFLLATISFLVVERPIREARPRSAHPYAAQGVVALSAAGALAVVAVIAVPGSTGEFYAPDEAQAEAVALEPVESLAPLRPSPTTTTAPTTTSAPPSTERPSRDSTTTSSSSTTVVGRLPPVPSRPVRILVVGDSTALATGAGLIEWAAAHPQYAQVSLAVSPGCGFIRGSSIVEDLPFQENCDRLLDEELPATLTSLLPDVVVLMVTMRDLENRTWSEEEGELTPFDPEYRTRLLAAQRSIVATLEAAGVPRVAWIVPPRPVAPFLEDRIHMADPVRYGIQERTIRTVAGEHPDLIEVIDLADWMDGRGILVDGTRRPDGVHFSPEASVEIADDFLAPAIITAALG
jgi:peptidoglycan/LPS O-acetylase OafA/YrhL